MNTARSFARRYVFLLVVLAIIIVLGLAYSLGFRVNSHGIMRVGTLTLTNLPAGTTVYVDKQLAKTAKTTGSVSDELMPGNHGIIVSAPNDYPWSTLVSISSTKDTAVNPFLVPENIKVQPLDSSSDAAAKKALAATALPTQASPLHLANGCANVYVSNDQIIAEAATSTPGCTPPTFLCTGGTCSPTVVFAPVTKIDAVLPYPHRQDALVVAVGGTLYALSLDPTNQQFFAPLVRAQAPRFAALPDGTIVTQAGKLIATIGL